ncbi:MAG TPA: hypothetical protein VNF73_15520 [Candidatus Saccharimonadales bacterium]|nr:hypothetical protein [Candidatus Saccharimonadales bacterium]
MASSYWIVGSWGSDDAGAAFGDVAPPGDVAAPGADGAKAVGVGIAGAAKATAGAIVPASSASANATTTNALPQDVERRLERRSSVTMVPARIGRGPRRIANPFNV